MRQLCSVLWLLCLAGSLAMAQDLNLSGRVTIAGSDDPLPGVTITVKGTTISTVTNPDGTYTLALSGMSEATVEFSFIGFKPVSQTVNSSNANLNISLEEAPLEVSEEMVITGFSTTVKRKNLANAVGSYSAEEITKVASPTVDGALSGLAPGVTVSANSGAPGGGISLKLRGVSTINGASQPLFVVDGVIISNDEIQSGVNAITLASGAGNSGSQDQPSNRVADLIPSDIESIEILKGPSAAAIYGSKASNGVVVITTKRGQAGKPQYEFSQSFGQRSLLKKVGTRAFTQETAIAQYGEVLGGLWQPTFFDYEEIMYGNDGAIFETQFSTRGGNEKTRYYFSGTTLDDEGIVERTGYDKSSIRLNLDHNFTARLTASLNLGFSRSTAKRGLTGNDNSGTTFGVATAFTPSFIDLRPDADGNYPDHPFNSANQVHIRDAMRNEETVNRTTGSFKLDYNIYESAQQALDFNLTTGVDYFSMENDAYFPNDLQSERDSANPGGAIIGETESMLETFYVNLTHTLYAGDNTFRTTGGLQYEQRERNNVNIFADNLIEGQSNLDNATTLTVAHGRVIQRDQGFFIQEEINFGEAIFVTAGIRGDKSSVNGDTDKIHSYPKASASIRLSEYSFWDNMEDKISEFKLRAAYGQTGNLPTFTAKRSAFINTNIEGSGGLLPGFTRGNAEIEPETSEELELGFDATFWGGRGTVEFSIFKQNIDNLLLFREIPPSSGNGREAFNGGEMEIDGTELALRLNPIKGEKVDWTTAINYYTYESVITQLEIPAYNTGGFATSLGRYRIEEGWSPTSIIGANTLPDGTFEKLGDETPDFQIGWTNDVRYGNWTLSWLLDMKEGGDVINLTKLLSDLGGTTADLDSNPGRVGAWASGDTRPWIEDGSYVKLRELKLQYSLGSGILKNLVYGKLSHVDFSIQGRNLKTWTDYTSYDPEVSNFGTVAIGRSVEVTPFPSSKSWYFNIAVGL